MALKTHDSKKENSPNGEKKIIPLPTGKVESGKVEPSSGEKIIPLPTGKVESGKAEPAITVEEKPEDLKERNKLQEAIDRIDVWITTAVENGLFTKNKVTYNSMINNLKSARSNLKEGNLIECDYKLDLVLDQYSDAANNTSRRWKLFNIYAIDVWIYLIGFLAVVFIFYFNGLNSILKSPPFAESAIHAATWGIIGAILRGL